MCLAPISKKECFGQYFWLVFNEIGQIFVDKSDHAFQFPPLSLVQRWSKGEFSATKLISTQCKNLVALLMLPTCGGMLQQIGHIF
jgi:hypothetical protein